jgi:hypothetical protein
MLWYTCLIKHAATLLRTKDCCTHICSENKYYGSIFNLLSSFGVKHKMVFLRSPCSLCLRIPPPNFFLCGPRRITGKCKFGILELLVWDGPIKTADMYSSLPTWAFLVATGRHTRGRNIIVPGLKREQQTAYCSCAGKVASTIRGKCTRCICWVKRGRASDKTEQDMTTASTWMIFKSYLHDVGMSGATTRRNTHIPLRLTAISSPSIVLCCQLDRLHTQHWRHVLWWHEWLYKTRDL